MVGVKGGGQEQGLGDGGWALLEDKTLLYCMNDEV